MAYRPVSPGVIGMQPIDEVSTEQKHPLGLEVIAEDPTYGVGTFVYVKGVASGALGSFVLITADDWSTSLLAANDHGPVGVLMAALVASTYGWAQINGKAVGKVLASYADNAAAYATATAGSVDDAVVAGDRVHNCKSGSAIGTPAAGLAEFEFNRPYVDNVDD